MISQRAPRFLWQAMLILLPVLVLCLAGVHAIRSDYRLASEEARQRAVEVAADLTPRLAGDFSRRIGELVALARQARGGADGQPWAGFDWGRDLPVEAVISKAGVLRDPVDYEESPGPPGWLRELTTDQWRTWLRASSGLPGETNVSGAVVPGVDTGLPAAAQSNLLFQALFPRGGWTAGNGGGPAVGGPNRVHELLEFAGRAAGVETPSGLPLSGVALLRALGELAGRGFEPAIRAEARRQVEAAPSVLIPTILGRGRSLFSLDGADGWKELGRIWEVRERARRLARQVAAVGRGLATETNLWVHVDGQDWFLALHPDTGGVGAGADGGADAGATASSVGMLMVPMGSATALARAAIEGGGVRVPQYFGLRVGWAGHPLLGAASAGRMLAESTGGVALPKLDGWGGGALGRLELRVTLGDGALLFREARRRAWIVGGVLAAAFVAALVGLAGAYHAFQRQLRLNIMKSNFVSAVSHELRAPLASVRLLAEGLARGKVTESERRGEYYRLIVQECRRLGALVENVLDFSRIEQARKQYEFEPADVGSMVRETLRLLEPYAADKQVRLSFEEDAKAKTKAKADADTGAPLVAVLDARAVQQALVNVLDNAIKHTPVGGCVRVGLDVPSNAASPGACFRLWVADEGPGIPEAERERIFEPFYRRGSELRRETQGVGIGLSIVKHVMDAHGGRILIDTPNAAGVRFSLEIPLEPGSGGIGNGVAGSAKS